MKELPGLPYENNGYATVPGRVRLMSRIFPSAAFYARIIHVVLSGSRQARRSFYGDAEWCASSLATIRAMEAVGGRFEITGIGHLRELDGPCVFIGNHMSTLETFALPAIIQPIKPVAFVVKQSLVDYPVFKHIMRSRNPIALGRTNPRDDLKTVFEEGARRLRAGISIIIFPQQPRGGTRSLVFDPSAFNTLGVKLAKRAGVPVVPLALKTDAWGNGRLLRDFGTIDPSITVHFAFGAPLPIVGRGEEEHLRIIEFISERLRTWGGKVEAGRPSSETPGT